MNQITIIQSALDIKNAVETDAFYLPGNKVAEQLLGTSQGSLLALSEYTNYFNYMRALTTQPLIADGQSGFGNPLNTYFTIRELEQAGADIILLNDLTYPIPDDGNLQATTLADFAGKLKSAIDAHHADATQIWAELTGFGEYDLAELQVRIQLAAKLGAQAIILKSAVAEDLQDLHSELPIYINQFNQPILTRLQTTLTSERMN